MYLIQIDPIGLQPAERCLALRLDMVPPDGRVRTVSGQPKMKFRRQDYAAAMSAQFESLANNLLANSFAVRVCIQEVDAGVNRALNYLDRFSVAGLATKSSAPQAKLADPDAGAAKWAVFHLRSQFSRRSTASNYRGWSVPTNRTTSSPPPLDSKLLAVLGTESILGASVTRSKPAIHLLQVCFLD